MIYKQTAVLPIIFQVDEGIILDVDNYLRRNNLFFTNVLVISGPSVSANYAREMSNRNNWTTVQITDNNKLTVGALAETIRIKAYQLVVGVGGGKVLDTVKRACYLTSTNCLAVPTILSNDGLISPVAVIDNEFGQSESLPGIMPLGVLIDLDIIKSSPLKYLRAAVGDIFSNLSATNDWIIANTFSERINDLSFHLSRGASNSLLELKSLDFEKKSVLRLLVSGLINSGLSMSLAGSSRPCSGSEHLISHAIDALNQSKPALHGEQVASASLFTLFLQKKLLPEHLEFIAGLKIPQDFLDFIPGDQKISLLDVLKKARLMRPGRVTILDEYTDRELLLEYQKFKAYISAVSHE